MSASRDSSGRWQLAIDAAQLAVALLALWWSMLPSQPPAAANKSTPPPPLSQPQGYVVQIGAMHSSDKDEIADELERRLEAAPDLFSDKAKFIALAPDQNYPAKLTVGTYATETAAKLVCQQYRGRGGDCFVRQAQEHPVACVFEPEAEQRLRCNGLLAAGAHE